MHSENNDGRREKNKDIVTVAVIVEGVCENGKPCRIVDNTGTLSQSTLEELLQALIKERQFGFQAMSDSTGTVRLGEPRFSHVQLGETLYRLLLFPYEAIIETF